MPEFLDFPMPYDQFQRYAVLQKFLETFYPAKQTRVLDVGGLAPDREGQDHILPLKLVYSGPGIVLDPQFSQQTDFVQGDGTRLPFRDNFFDIAAALDVIEHIPAPGREDFLKELCRVSKGSVLVSAPFQDKNIEKVEELLFCQIKKRYGAEHQQLLEHKKFGLPDIQDISTALAQHTHSGISFSYGSLTNWMMSQSLKNSFMFKKNAAKIHYFLDKWQSHRPQKQEFIPPFSRNYWIYSYDIRQKKLQKGIKAMQEALTNLPPVGLDPHEFPEFHQALLEYLCSDQVAALVVTEGFSRYLKECLNHLLTQKVHLDLDVSIWDLNGDEALKEYLKSQLPGVKYYTCHKDDQLPSALFKVLHRLSGEYILMLADNILLPANTVSQVFAELNNHPETDVLSPRIDWDEKEAISWGRADATPAEGDFDSDKATWLQSDCLFFRKESVYSRKWKSPSLTKDQIFLWERAKVSRPILYVPQHTVYKK